ncbi:TIR domain-containing protein [Actinoplanes sp. NPDC051411]|uniref:TIR domain-containing protein n=1 Tax=Actinoplanes sp. NPDC051411 TaxID=3155522 RepID=UPI00344373C6
MTNRHVADQRSVFLVAGRDDATIAAVVTFIRALGLRIVEWEQAVAHTGEPNPYIGDVVRAGMEMAAATLVLFTPDDLVRLRDDLLRDHDGPAERNVAGQARPNVLYEAGFADCLGRDRTILVEVGPVKAFTDVSGRHVVRFDGSPMHRKALVSRMESAGLKPDISGTDWLHVGDVAGAVAAAGVALIRSRQPE